MRSCTVDGCKNKHVAKGFCSSHYSAWKRHGDPQAVTRTMSKRGAPRAWLLAHVDHQSDDCLYWPFAVFPSGYGQYMAETGGTNAHREMCRLAHGEPASDSLVAAHSCRNGRNGCVNPRHVRWATSQENTHDRYRDNTMNFGLSNPMGKLDDDTLEAIADLKGQMTQRAAARKFGISKSHVGSIWRGEARRQPPVEIMQVAA